MTIVNINKDKNKKITNNNQLNYLKFYLQII